MSFGAFNLFNFFQQPNFRTGSYPTVVNNEANQSLIISGGNERSGTVADFNWFFPYVGTNYFESLIIRSREYENVYLMADSYYSRGLGYYGLRFATASNSFSGKFIPAREVNFIQSEWHGASSPLERESSSNYTSFSGEASGLTPEKAFFNSQFSGSYSGIQPESEKIWTIFSGAVKSGGERKWIKTEFSGKIGSGHIDAYAITSIFSGKFIPSISDTVSSISFEITNLEVATNGVQYIYITTGDTESSITYEITSVSTDTNA
jgi:hypothetical protein